MVLKTTRDVHRHLLIIGQLGGGSGGDGANIL